jgi:hypothetical protein
MHASAGAALPVTAPAAAMPRAVDGLVHDAGPVNFRVHRVLHPAAVRYLIGAWQRGPGIRTPQWRQRQCKDNNDQQEFVCALVHYCRRIAPLQRPNQEYIPHRVGPKDANHEGEFLVEHQVWSREYGHTLSLNSSTATTSTQSPGCRLSFNSAFQISRRTRTRNRLPSLPRTSPGLCKSASTCFRGRMDVIWDDPC